ncbi:30S ribosomal protein S5 [bacterium]|nr:MAG: 30S ribosomal protein S5 [bacterium]
MFQQRNPHIREEQSQYDQEIIDIARVSRTVAGGRRFSFRATVALGNKQGLIGLGIGKGKDVAQSIEKASKKAEKKMMQVVRSEGTIPVDVIGRFKSARVLLKPTQKGHGLIAGGVVRSLCSLSGIENISAKILSRTNNKINIARATLEGFKRINQFHAKSEYLKLQASKKTTEEKKVAKTSISKIKKEVKKDN